MQPGIRKIVERLLIAGWCMGLLSGCGREPGDGTGGGAIQVPVETLAPTIEPAVATEKPEEVSRLHTYQMKTEEGCFYDDAQNPLGSLLTRQIIVYRDNNPEDVVIRAEIIWPEIDVGFEGAGVINDILWEHGQGFDVEMPPEDEEWEPSITGVHQFYESIFRGFSYQDDYYISFFQHGYAFYGGAHGMPYRTPYTFELQTGRRLELTDIIGNSEEELKELVVKAFEMKIQANPEIFYLADALDTVRETISLESDFVLTPEGIMFYMYPYDIASFADGFPEVVISYEAFDMKIDI